MKINPTSSDRYIALGREIAERGAAPPTADGLLALRGVVEAVDAEEATPEARQALEAAMAESLGLAPSTG